MIKYKSLIITNCTNRKRTHVPTTCRIGEFQSARASDLADKWITTLIETNQKTLAENLYCGRVFTEVKCAVALLNAKLFITSAGLGLIESTQEVPTYSSTISKGSSDYVLDKLTEGNVSDWWKALNRKSPFSVAFNTYPYELILIAMSLPYFRLIEQQLIELNASEKSKLRLFLRVDSNDISTCLVPYLMPYDDRFDSQNGPNRGTLNDFPQRALRHFVESILTTTSNHSCENHSVLVENVLKKLQPYKIIAGARCSDDEISDLILKHRSECLSSPSKMLRFFRDSLGIACEQKRFQRLFHNVTVLMETI
jgi:hypothetical protein